MNKAAIDGVLGKLTAFGERKQLKNQLKQKNINVYIYFLAFEIAAYLAIHYHKRLESAHLHFVLEEDAWTLADADSIYMSSLPRKEYVKAELWEPTRVQFDLSDKEGKRTPIFQEKPVERNR